MSELENRLIENKIFFAFYVVVLVAGIVYMAYKFENSTAFMICGIAYVFMLYICMIDFKTALIPDYSIITMGIFGILLLPFNPFVNVFTVLVGMLGIGGFSFLVWKLTQGQMGLGDVKLLAVIPLYFGWKSGLMIFMYGLIIGALAGLLLIAFRRVGRKTSMPFAPFLMFGMLLEMHIKF